MRHRSTYIEALITFLTDDFITFLLMNITLAHLRLPVSPNKALRLTWSKQRHCRHVCHRLYSTITRQNIKCFQ